MELIYILKYTKRKKHIKSIEGLAPLLQYTENMDTKKGKNKGLNAFLDKQVKKGKKKAPTEEQKTETV